MSMTLAQKVLARTSGRKKIDIGEVVFAEPDLFELIDLVLPHYLKTLRGHGITRLRYPERCIVFADHEVPSQSEGVAALKKELRQTLKDLGVTQIYSEGRHGISHQAIIERGHVVPGMLVIGPDTHIMTLGCVGALAPPINYEALQALATGDIWLKVPETVRVILAGRPRPGVMSRDIAQRIAAWLGRDRCDYRVIEFAGPAAAFIDMDARMTLCNVMVEVGAKAAIFEPDDVTRRYLEPRVPGGFETVKSDPDAPYAEVMEYDLETVEPMIAAPPRPDNIVPISQVAGLAVDQVYIGSCAGGRMEDLRAAARFIAGRKVHEDVRMIVVPTSQEIYAAASREGLLATFVEAGALVTAPSCGLCYGNLAPLVDGEVCVGTGTTNMPGRMGSAKAAIYIANAVTAAAAAVAGRIVDPADFLEEAS